jgi:hypothetical protein
MRMEVDMAIATHALVDALRQTAARIESGDRFRWAHMGACTCGHLAQVVTERSAAEIHRLALERAGDWGAQGVEYCAASGLPIDHIIDRLVELGLAPDDLAHLERLSDRRVLRRLPDTVRLDINFRDREHVILYLRAFADLLDERLPAIEAAA